MNRIAIAPIVFVFPSIQSFIYIIISHLLYTDNIITVCERRTNKSALFMCFREQLINYRAETPTPYNNSNKYKSPVEKKCFIFD